MTLKETGVCEVYLPEALFDADYPGHYMRRIQTMDITIPCVVGPYTNINCTLTLLSNSTRISSTAAGTYAEGVNDARFVDNFAAVQSIATSHGQNDAGLFELNFRDERYLPFEGAGTISRWRIELPQTTNAFDFNTITDVILRVRYTARDGGAPLQQAALQALASDPSVTNGARLFSAKHEFAAQWIQFLNPTDPNTEILQLDFSKGRFPFQLRGKTVQITAVNLYLFLDETALSQSLQSIPPLQFALTCSAGTTPVSYNSVSGSPTPLTLSIVTDPTSSQPLPIMFTSVPITASGDNRGAWSLEFPRTSTGSSYFTAPPLSSVTPIPSALAPEGAQVPQLDPTKVADLLIVCEYSIS